MSSSNSVSSHHEEGSRKGILFQARPPPTAIGPRAPGMVFVSCVVQPSPWKALLPSKCLKCGGHEGPADRVSWVHGGPGFHVAHTWALCAGSSSLGGTELQPPPAAATMAISVSLLHAQCSVVHPIIGTAAQGPELFLGVLGIFAENIIGKSSLEKAIRTPPADKWKRMFQKEQKGEM